MAYKKLQKEMKLKNNDEEPKEEKIQNKLVDEQQVRLEKIKSHYRNKQHTLVLASRRITSRYRHLLLDLRELLPHHKKEAKYEGNMRDLGEIMDVKNCNNCIFFECRKKTDLYLWIAKGPEGPSVKFLLTNVHTMDELKFTGNCLKGSRPVLFFDNNFDASPQLRLIKEMISQAFNTPYMHPRSKPFIDHMMCFYYVGERIWFRNYQVTEEYLPSNPGKNKVEDALVEIGPRFVLNPIKILQGCFTGKPVYENAAFINPNMIRQMDRNLRNKDYVQKLLTNKKSNREVREKKLYSDDLDKVFVDLNSRKYKTNETKEKNDEAGDDNNENDEGNDEGNDNDEDGGSGSMEE